ncbi:hypothetical protein [Streptodolium elevatio]|uniref:Uncharacterized protein n=1 Tax=Streptodolium elevatio TaxID=3157996 RepID=A0ABV3DP28_9ACTN
MASFTTRYRNGEHEAVWTELRLLGPVPASLSEDCADVAAETMRRVRRHVDRLGDAYRELGFTGGEGVAPPPEPAELAELDRLAAEIGGLPYALDACMRIVGFVDFIGDCEPLNLWYSDHERGKQCPVLPDPLATPPTYMLALNWESYCDDHGDEYHDDEYHDDSDEPIADRPGFALDFAPDDISKANYSGSTQTVELPSRVADPPLSGISERSGITLVDYLRLSIAWGGLPGWSLTDKTPPEALSTLRVTPDF